MYYTIGYEGVGIDTFIACLKQNNIQILADVRERPLSRKPGFSQRALRDAVSSQGIRYQHFQKLGCPPNIRDAYNTDKNWGNYRTAFNRYLALNPDAVAELVQFVKKCQCALMCFEADQNFCHRSLIARQLEEQYGIRVVNLHPASPKARQITFLETSMPYIPVG